MSPGRVSRTGARLPAAARGGAAGRPKAPSPLAPAGRRGALTALGAAFAALLVLPAAAGEARPGGAVSHEISVFIEPEAHRLTVRDAVTLPAGAAVGREGERRSVTFLLHAGLRPSCATPGARLERLGRAPKDADFALPSGSLELLNLPPVEMFRLRLPPGPPSFVLNYAGSISHPLETQAEDYARGFQETPGDIGPEGVFLSGRSVWYPWFGEELVTFAMAVRLPAGWDAVSQGDRGFHERGELGTLVEWRATPPQEEVYLIAGRFAESSRTSGPVQLMTLLREKDDALAGKYLDAAAQYVGMYSSLLGEYPYGKFALVENFWETGYGMPSFTLLGSKVIRLPFILHSSYPHEILHNWWANGVYVRPRTGNWSEGLTAYLADHLIEEQRGTAAEYRQATLQKYADYVTRGKDFALVDFRSRHSPATEAVGYGKSLMFFHGLRLSLGDEAFTRGLRAFAERHMFGRASWEDLRQAFEQASGADLRAVFDQAIRRSGAPRLRAGAASARPDGTGWALSLAIEQVQQDEPWLLQVPLAVTMEGRARAFQTTVRVAGRRQEIEIKLPARPLRVDVDPTFDLFRKLERREIPPALSQVFGAERSMAILPAAAPGPLREAYTTLAVEWGRGEPGRLEIRLDSELDALPADRSVWLFGWENRFREAVEAPLRSYGGAIEEGRTRFGATSLPRDGRSIVLAVRHPGNEEHSLAFVAADPPAALPGLGRKLPHYHKYSHLGFEGSEPANVAKGRWPVLDSPMTVLLAGGDPAGDSGRTGRAPAEAAEAPTGQAGAGPEGPPPRRAERAALAPVRPLATLPPAFSSERMIETVRTLASAEFGGRGFGSPGADAAAELIAAKFREAGLQPAGDAEGSYFQAWTDSAGDPRGPAGEVRLRNVVGILPGSRSEWAGQSVVVGAHYDHLGLGWPDVKTDNAGRVHPGADDNASGVAVLLELARAIASGPRPERTVVFAAFAAEEAGRRGSTRYVRGPSRMPARGCRGMINLDTVGRLGAGRILVLGCGSAREWVHIFNGAGYVTGAPVECVASDPGGSDQRSFLEAGIPAVQLFTGPHPDYHAPGDTADKVDGAGLVKVASVAREAVDYLAGRADPMTVSIAADLGGAPGAAAPGVPGGEAAGPRGAGGTQSGRRVSLGTVPDFAYSGPGVRLSGVAPGSPAEKAGLIAGDVITRLGTTEVADLRALSEALGGLEPGDRITVTFLREGVERSVEAELAAR